MFLCRSNSWISRKSFPRWLRRIVAALWASEVRCVLFPGDRRAVGGATLDVVDHAFDLFLCTWPVKAGFGFKAPRSAKSRTIDRTLDSPSDHNLVAFHF